MTYRAEPTKANPKGVEVVVHTLTRPTKTRNFKVAGGVRKFTAVRVQRPVKEFIVYAPESTKPVSKSTKEYYTAMSKNKGKNKDKADKVTDDDLAELESLEDVVDADEPEEDTESKPAKKGKGKGKGGKNKGDAASGEDKPKKKRSGGAEPGKSRAAANGKIGTAEIAAEGGCDARTLRMVLRKHEIPKDEETGRYEWSSLKDPTVKKILKLLKEGEADKVKNEGLQRLKDSKAEKDAAAKTEDAGKGDKGKKDKGKKDKKNKK